MDHIMVRAVGAVVVAILLTSTTAAALQLSLVHKYAHLEGSPASTQGRGASPEYSALLRAHDRRRLAALFSLRGSPNVGLYYTQITFGTPPKNYHVQVDTGSDVLWLNCAPCSSCRKSSSLPGVPVQLYDPALSSTDTVLACTHATCLVASYGNAVKCTVSSPVGACSYSILYGDQSTTEGYIINDVMTFQNSATTTASANVYFGCGTKQTGNLLNPGNVDGIIGFGRAAISVPSQLVSQGLVSNVFAHCLKGDVTGGGNLVIGNVTEPAITYTPMVPNQSLYNVRMENIAVNGVNVTDPAALAISSSNLGVIMDSGATLAYLIQPAYNQFVAAIEAGAPVASQRISDGRGGYMICWDYSGDFATTFPPVNLFFDGGAVMNLGPANYLYAVRHTRIGATVQCFGWNPTTGTATAPGYTVLGDIVLKDQLVVYDNSKQMLGWKPFICSQPIPVA